MSLIKQSFALQFVFTLLIFLFAYTSASKFQEYKGFALALSRFPLIGNRNVVFAWVLILTESIVALLLLIPKTKLVGLYCSFVLLFLFTVYIGYMVKFATHLPCLCGGIIKHMNWTQHFFFNSFLTLLSVWGINMQKKYLRGNKFKEMNCQTSNRK